MSALETARRKPTAIRNPKSNIRNSLGLAALLIALLAPLRATAGELHGVEAVFDRPATLAAADKPTVCILDTEHPDVVREKVHAQGPAKYKGQVLKRRAAELSGLPCVLVHYSEVTWKEFDNRQIKAILLMAQKCRMNDELQAALFAFLRANKIPLIGFCGGQQMIAEAYGAVTVPLRNLRPGETDTHPQYYPGRFKEWGFMPVRIVQRDPLFDGFDASLVVKEMHAFEVQKLPDVLVTLASTDEVRHEAIKHRERPLYGTQFHPEAYDEAHPDGRTLLENFFKLSGCRK